MAVVVYVPSRLGEDWWEDLPVPGAGDDGKAVTYDHDTQAFVYAAAGGGTPPGSDTQLIFNDGGAYGADPGLTYAKATDRLTVAGGLVAPSMRPASDSTTALQWQVANGDAFVTGNTTDRTLKIYNPNISGASHIWSDLLQLNNDTGTLTISRSSQVGAGFDSWRMRVYPNPTLSTTPFDFALDYNFGSPGVGLTGMGINFLTSDARFKQTASQLSLEMNPALTYSQWGYSGQGIGVLHDVDTYWWLLRISPTTTAIYARYSDCFVGVGTTAPVTKLDVADTNAGTGAIQNALTMRSTHASGAGTGFGVGFRAGLKSSTTADQNAGRIIFKWGDATHATRSSIGQVSAFYIGDEHFPITWGASSAGPLLSFGAVTTPIATPVLATGASATPDDIITVLQSYGLVKQS